MKRLVFYLFFLVMPFYLVAGGSLNETKVLAQQSRADSLRGALKVVKDDTSRVYLLNQLAWEMKSYKPDTSIFLSLMALNLSKENNHSFEPSLAHAGLKGLATSNHYLAAFYLERGGHTLALEYAHKAILLMNELHDQSGQAKVFNVMGVIYWKKGNHERAFEYYQKALEINVRIGNKQSQMSNLSNIGALYSAKGDYLIALDYYFKALKLTEENQDEKSRALALCNIGSSYSVTGNYTQAMDYELQALKIQEKVNDRTGAAVTLGCIAFIFGQQNDPKNAEIYFQKALQYDKALGNKVGIVHNLGGLGEVYAQQKMYAKALTYQMQALKIAEEENYKQEFCYHLSGVGSTIKRQGDSAWKYGNVQFAKQVKYPQAISFFIKSRKIAEQLGDRHSISASYGEIGLLNIKLGNYETALQQLQIAVNIADSINDAVLQKGYHFGLSEVYTLKGNDKKALEQYIKYSNLKDTLNAVEKNKEVTKKEMNYEFDKKEMLIKAAQEKKELIHDKEKQKYRITIYFAIGIATLILVLGLMLYRNKVQRMRASHLQAELRFLKDQINPHLLFNILNSIYVLLQTDAEKAASTILKLSDMLRYQLYDCTTDLVPLNEEITFINDYLEIQKIRSAHKLQLNFIQTGSADDLFIAPLILITFIENAFKFGVESAVSDAYINIQLRMEPLKIQFRIENNIPGNSEKAAKGGIGLQNVQRRLDLLYPGKHTLTRFDAPGIFAIELVIDAS